jgi:DNA polymerase III subunit delta'
VFENIVGNQQIKEYLTRMVEKKAVGNSLLFAGPDGIGKGLFAKRLAESLLESNKESHPDLHIYRPEGKIGMHSIDAMRQFSETVYLAPFEAKKKVFIIHDAERMLTYSANALLKTFEEPSLDSVIILLSSAPESLLPTVLSRCRVIRFHRLTDTEIVTLLQQKWHKTKEEAEQIAFLAEGSLSTALRLSEEKGNFIRERILRLLAQDHLKTYADLALVAKEISEHVEAAKKVEGDLVRAECLKGLNSELTASQQQQIEKEVEGAVAMRLAEQADALFHVILSWYRDLQLLRVNGSLHHLINRDKRLLIEQALQRGNLLPIEQVQAALSTAKLSLERSTSLNLTLEHLFLQLNLL